MTIRVAPAALLAALCLPAPSAADPAAEARARLGAERIRVVRDGERIAEIGGLSLAPPIGATGERSARWFLERHGDLLGLGAGGLEPGNAEERAHGDQRIFLFEIAHAGLPVFLSRAAVQVDPRGRVRRAAASLPRGDPPSEPHPGSDPDRWEEWASGRGLRIEHAREGWIADAADAIVPAVLIDAVALEGGEPVSLFVHARSGAVAHAAPRYDTEGHLAAVFRENPVTTPEVDIVELEGLDEPAERLYGAWARVERCYDAEKCSQTAPVAAPDDRGDFLYAPDLAPYTFDDCFSEVNAYRNISDINRWVRDTFGWDHLFHDETWIFVKVGIAWYNAAFVHGNESVAPYIIFGQDVIDMSYDSDVAYHEFGHAVNRSTWDHSWFAPDERGIDTSMFGIEEGLADIWATTFSGDPVMNCYVTPCRSADNDLSCPADLRSEGHMEARMVAGLAWDARERIGAEPMEHVVYRSLAFLPSDAGFDTFAEVLAGSAEDLAAEGAYGVEPGHAAVIREEAEARGFYSEECLERLVPLPEGEPRRVYGYGRNRTGGHDHPFGLQWKLTAPDDARAFRLFLSWRYPDGVEPGFRVHLSRGRPVEVAWRDAESLEDGDSAFDATADYEAQGGPAEVGYPFAGLDPLFPGEEVYVLLSGDIDERTVVVDAEVYYLASQPPPPGWPADGGVPSGGETEARSGGTACSTTAISSAGRPVSPIGLLAGAARRAFIGGPDVL